MDSTWKEWRKILSSVEDGLPSPFKYLSVPFTGLRFHFRDPLSR